GPEETFRKEVFEAAERALELEEQDLHVDVDELARLYSGAHDAAPIEERPLPPADRSQLWRLYVQFRKLRDHPLLPYKEPDPVLSAAFQHLGWAPARRPAEDLSPADVLAQFRRVRRSLAWLAFKHFALRRVRELCRLHQQKWALAGPLAPLGAAELRQVIESLITRHLVLREADGSLTAHPAVRDHFARLGGAPE